MANDLMLVQVCYALPDRQMLIDVNVPAGATIEQTIRHSGILQQCPDIDLDHLRVGIFGKLKSLDTQVHPHERIEIYRPLKADPKVARQRRVQKHREQGTAEGQKWRRHQQAVKNIKEEP